MLELVPPPWRWTCVDLPEIMLACPNHEMAKVVTRLIADYGHRLAAALHFTGCRVVIRTAACFDALGDGSPEPGLKPLDELFMYTIPGLHQRLRLTGSDGSVQPVE